MSQRLGPELLLLDTDFFPWVFLYTHFASYCMWVDAQTYAEFISLYMCLGLYNLIFSGPMNIIDPSFSLEKPRSRR